MGSVIGIWRAMTEDTVVVFSAIAPSFNRVIAFGDATIGTHRKSSPFGAMWRGGDAPPPQHYSTKGE